MARIRRLPEALINRIAAGEVVERPSSALKELIENALDAGATRIEIRFQDGGRTMLSVTDNGCGMDAEDLKRAVEPHATSKLTDNTLDAIQTFGFRGEALPSIASISRLRLMSREEGAGQGWCIHINHGDQVDYAPMALNTGTCVEVSDFFAHVPARLKFLKTERTERAWILDTVERLGLAHPGIHWTVHEGDRLCIELCAAPQHQDTLSALGVRLSQVLGHDIMPHMVKLQESDPMLGMTVEGFMSLPTYHKGQNHQVYTYANGRAVKDKVLNQAVRVGYQDVLAHDRYPIVVLMLRLPYDEIDVNVHPAKTEVRFQKPQDVRRLIVRAIRKTLEREAQRSAGTLVVHKPLSEGFVRGAVEAVPQPIPLFVPQVQESRGSGYRPPADLKLQDLASPSSSLVDPVVISAINRPLGEARAQIHATYILSETRDGLIMIDQHAAHERIVYEKLKSQHSAHCQTLMIPDVVELRPLAYDALMSFQQVCLARGLVFDSFGTSTVLVREIPALVAGCDTAALVRDLAESALEHQGIESIEEKTNHIYATMACHHSLRAGHILTVPEMNALLRQMEETLMSGQCNHGRPTYITWTRAEIDRAFGRT